MRRLKHGKMSGGCGDSCCLKLEGLNVRIQGEEILEDVSFHLHCGEITALIGNISRQEGADAPYLHLHITIGNPVTGQVHAGHLSSATISATLELFLQVWDGQVGRKFSDAVGLNLLEF